MTVSKRNIYAFEYLLDILYILRVCCRRSLNPRDKIRTDHMTSHIICGIKSVQLYKASPHHRTHISIAALVILNYKFKISQCTHTCSYNTCALHLLLLSCTRSNVIGTMLETQEDTHNAESQTQNTALHVHSLKCEELCQPTTPGKEGGGEAWDLSIADSGTLGERFQNFCQSFAPTAQRKTEMTPGSVHD